MMFDRTLRVFVAGHTGLIGSALVRKLAGDGFTRIITATRSELDLADAEKVRRFFRRERPHVVFLAAGRVGGIVENQTFPADFITENLAIQLNVLRAARENGVERLVFFASSCMYPRECPQPMAEDMLLAGKPEPTSLPYAISKLAGTQMCLAYNKQDGVKRFLPVIPNSAYGPNDNFDPGASHVLSAIMRKMHEARAAHASEIELWGSGAPRREFVHADDIADACCFVLERNVESLELPVNIGVGRDYSIKELAHAIAGVVGYTGAIRWNTEKPDGAPQKLLDSSRLYALGWRPRISLDAGLKSTYEWYLQNAGEVVGKAVHI